METNNNLYTRIYGILAVEAVGSEEQKRKLADVIIANPDNKDERLIGELIMAFAPYILSTQDILLLIQRIDRPEQYPSAQISHSLKEFSLLKCPEAEVLYWIRGLLALIKQSPVIERRFCEVSVHYSWLLHYAVLAAERLVRAKHPSALDESVIETISLAQAASSYDRHLLEEHALPELIPKWPELNLALFWFDVALKRRNRNKEQTERLTSWWQVGALNYFWRFTEIDFEKIIEDVSIKADMDDRLVALSLSFQIYKESGRGRVRRLSLKKAVHGVPELEDALNFYAATGFLMDTPHIWCSSYSEA